MSSVVRKCQCCGVEFKARSADVKRGWARFCSKSCKARRQEQNTGQHRAHQQREQRHAGGFGLPTFSNAHLDNTEL